MPPIESRPGGLVIGRSSGRKHGILNPEHPKFAARPLRFLRNGTLLVASFARDLGEERLDATIAGVRSTALLRLLAERQRRLVCRRKLMMNNTLDAPLRKPQRYRLLASHENELSI
jgi:hypothetical protein